MFRFARVVATTLFIVLILLSSVGAQNPHQEQIDKWLEYDSLNPPADDPILVVGDSAIRFWESLKRDFADYEILQRGFGGARLTDLSYFVNDVVLRYDPLAIVTDAGLNDYRHDSATSSQIFNRYVEFVDLVHTGQDQSRPPIPILHMGLMPTIGHADVWDSIVLPANLRISDHAAGDDSLYYLDVATPMLATALGPGQPPSPDLFIIDGVHLTAAGYTIWSDVLRNGLEAASLAAKIPTNNPLHPAVGSRILIDFGPDDPVHGGQAINPDVNGNHWNNWHSVPGNDNPAAGGPVILDGESLGNLLTAQGNETGIDLIVTGEMAAAGKSSGGLLSPDSALLGDLAIATATEDYFFAFGIEYLEGLQTGGFMLTGLDPALTYELRFFGSSTASEFRTTDYVVYGAGASMTVSLLTSGENIGSDGDYDGNDDHVAVARGLRSDQFGQIFIDITSASSDPTYLNCMEIVVVPEPTSLLLVASVGLGWWSFIVNGRRRERK